METGMRGYLLAGKKDFLTPYTNGRSTFNRLIDDLSKTVSDNPAQVKLLNDVSNTINDWQNKVTEPVISLREQIGDAKSMNDMANIIKEARGKQYFDKFREQLATFISREESLLNQRQQEAASSTDIKQLKQLSLWVEHTYQAIGAETINQGVVEIDGVTQHNSHIAQQSAAAATQLSEQAKLLESTISQFKLRDSSRY